tara:strand:- start:1796 stop:5290 length:3495 start_codon:yes stop_codon:yes gene_type:complete
MGEQFKNAVEEFYKQLDNLSDYDLKKMKDNLFADEDNKDFELENLPKDLSEKEKFKLYVCGILHGRVNYGGPGEENMAEELEDEEENPNDRQEESTPLEEYEKLIMGDQVKFNTFFIQDDNNPFKPTLESSEDDAVLNNLYFLQTIKHINTDKNTYFSTLLNRSPFYIAGVDEDSKREGIIKRYKFNKQNRNKTNGFGSYKSSGVCKVVEDKTNWGQASWRDFLIKYSLYPPRKLEGEKKEKCDVDNIKNAIRVFKNFQINEKKIFDLINAKYNNILSYGADDKNKKLFGLEQLRSFIMVHIMTLCFYKNYYSIFKYSNNKSSEFPCNIKDNIAIKYINMMNYSGNNNKDDYATNKLKNIYSPDFFSIIKKLLSIKEKINIKIYKMNNGDDDNTLDNKTEEKLELELLNNRLSKIPRPPDLLSNISKLLTKITRKVDSIANDPGSALLKCNYVYNLSVGDTNNYPFLYMLQEFFDKISLLDLDPEGGIIKIVLIPNSADPNSIDFDVKLNVITQHEDPVKYFKHLNEIIVDKNKLYELMDDIWAKEGSTNQTYDVKIIQYVDITNIIAQHKYDELYSNISIEYIASHYKFIVDLYEKTLDSSEGTAEDEGERKNIDSDHIIEINFIARNDDGYKIYLDEYHGTDRKVIKILFKYTRNNDKNIVIFLQNGPTLSFITKYIKPENLYSNNTLINKWVKLKLSLYLEKTDINEKIYLGKVIDEYYLNESDKMPIFYKILLNGNDNIPIYIINHSSHIIDILYDIDNKKFIEHYKNFIDNIDNDKLNNREKNFDETKKFLKYTFMTPDYCLLEKDLPYVIRRNINYVVTKFIKYENLLFSRVQMKIPNDRFEKIVDFTSNDESSAIDIKNMMDNVDYRKKYIVKFQSNSNMMFVYKKDDDESSQEKPDKSFQYDSDGRLTYYYKDNTSLNNHLTGVLDLIDYDDFVKELILYKDLFDLPSSDDTNLINYIFSYINQIKIITETDIDKGGITLDEYLKHIIKKVMTKIFDELNKTNIIGDGEYDEETKDNILFKMVVGLNNFNNPKKSDILSQKKSYLKNSIIIILYILGKVQTTFNKLLWSNSIIKIPSNDSVQSNEENNVNQNTKAVTNNINILIKAINAANDQEPNLFDNEFHKYLNEEIKNHFKNDDEVLKKFLLISYIQNTKIY